MNTLSSALNAPMSMREKMWKELTVDEKVERMREMIKSQNYKINNANSKIDDLTNDFKNHEHLNGKVVKDIKIYNSGDSIRGVSLSASAEAEKEGNVYF